MEKMKLETANVAANNIERIGELFPNCITESKDENDQLKRAINFDMLRQMLSDDVVDGKEAYEFTWVGKKASIVEANKPIRKTLRPCKEDSVNWDTTENLYIEGDNLQVLKLLQESYLGKVKMIYIDPPYNTGNDFIYNDDFKMDLDDYAEETGEYDDVGNRMFKNEETAGRYHSDWCSMIYSRLLLARNLLSDDGVIFISIDDHEQENLKKICDEVFGSHNFISQLVWQRAFSPKNDAKYISNSHDYILMVAKNIDAFKIGRLPRTEEANARYSNPDNDPRGVWTSGDISVKTYNPNTDYPITTPSGKIVYPPSGRCWRTSKENFDKLVADNRIYFGTNGENVPRMKRFLSELKLDGMAPTSLLLYQDVGHSQEGSQEVTKILDAGVFDGPKPTRLICRLLTLANLKDDSIILDFFSGSGSTAHAIFEKNAQDGKNNRFIMVQIPENTADKSKAAQQGYKTICEIGKERIRRAGQKILSENQGIENLDIGFRVLKLDDTNMKDVYYGPQEYTQDALFNLAENVKEDRTGLDLLFGCLLEWGLPLSMPYSSDIVDGYTIHNYNNGDLIACFDKAVPDHVIRYMAKLQPLRVVFRDNSFIDSPAKINVGEIFKSLAPDTRIKVI